MKEAGGFINGLMADFGWLFAFVYLLCVGVRLAKFNVITNPLVPGSDKRKSTGEFMGLRASGERLEVLGFAMYRLRDGKIVELWEVADRLGLMRQLGAL